MFAAVLAMPVSAFPIAYVGLAYGVTQAAIVGVGATILTAFLLSPTFAVVFGFLLLFPTLVLIHQALLSRPIENTDDFEFYPPRRLILVTLGITSLGIIILFSSIGGEGGLPQAFANAMAASPEINAAFADGYDLSSPENMLRAANFIIITGFVSWPLLLLGNLQIVQILVTKMGKNLRPATDYTTLTLPIWLIGLFAGLLVVAWVSEGWLATLAATLATLVMSAYFLLGLAIIHAISRHWNGRIFFWVVLYFVIIAMAWLIIPISLMGLLDTRFDFRGLNNPDKSSHEDGDKE